MNRQPLLYLVLFFTAFSCTNTPAPEKKTIRRLSRASVAPKSVNRMRGFKLILIYLSIILFILHSSTISSGQMLDCTSPMCAQRNRNMQRRDCPMPPPIESGILSSIRLLWKNKLKRSSHPLIFN